MSGRCRARAALRPLAFACLAFLVGCLEEPVPEGRGDSSDGPGAAGGPQVLVVNGLSFTISRFDLTTNEMTVQAATTGAVPNRITPWPDGGGLLLACSGDNAIRVLDTGGLGLRREIDLGVGRNPWLAVPSSRSGALVTNWVSNGIAFVDLETGDVRSEIAVGPGPEGAAIAEGHAWIACTNYLGNENRYGPGVVAVVSLLTGHVVETFEVGSNPQDVLIAHDGRVHVLCTGSYGQGNPPAGGRVHVFDPDTRDEVGTLELGGSPGRFALAPDGIVWVAGTSDGIRRYDAATIASLPDPVAPELGASGWTAVAVDPEDGRVWATNFDLDVAVVIEPTAGELLGTWLVGDGPVDVCVVRP